MRRILLFIFSNIICLLCCYAQLSELEGIWKYSIYHDVVFAEFSNGHWGARCSMTEINYFRIEVIGKEVYVRGKEVIKWHGRPGYDTTTNYIDIRDIKVNDNGSVTFKHYFDSSIWTEDMKEPPAEFDKKIAYSIVTLNRAKLWLDVEYSNLNVFYYKNGIITDTDTVDYKKGIYHYYNEKDNW